MDDGGAAGSGRAVGLASGAVRRGELACLSSLRLETDLGLQAARKASDFAADAKMMARRESERTANTGFGTFFKTGL